MKKLGFTPLALTALLVIGIITSFPLVVANNVASWSMDDGSGNTVTDSVGGNTGTLHGASWTSAAIVFNSSGYAWDLGKGSTNTPFALDLNGKDNYVEVPDTPDLKSSFFSLAFWISPDTSSNFGNIMGKQYYVEGQQEGWMIYWDSDSGSPPPIRLTAFSPSHTEISSVCVIVPLGEWTHLAFTLGNDTITAYKNGQLVGETIASNYLPTNQPFRIGRAWGDSHYFDGLIDNVQFYNTSLTQTDIQNIYQSYTTTTERSTILQLNQISMSQGQESNITAKLVDDTMGRALTNVNVTFIINNNDIATVRTDSRGIAQILYNPQETGTFALTATYNGNGVYYGCAQTVSLVVNGSPLQQQVLLGVAGGAIALGAVLFIRRKRRSNGVEWGYDMEEFVGKYSIDKIVRTLELSAESLDRTKKAFERAVNERSS